jgi:ribulose-phosphate 3-epimerase
MTVNPGFGGQTLIPNILKKITDLKEMLQKSGRSIDIEVDGGITVTNVGEVLDAGANVIVSGTSVFKGNIKENVSDFQKKFMKYSSLS